MATSTRTTDDAPGSTVFISSPIHGLIDLRSELARYLFEIGLTPILSHDYACALRKGRNSDNVISSCSESIRAAGTVLFVLSDEYGSPTDNSPEWSESYTHWEYWLARSLGKQMVFFVRASLESEYRRHSAGEPEPSKARKRRDRAWKKIEESNGDLESSRNDLRIWCRELRNIYRDRILRQSPAESDPDDLASRLVFMADYEFPMPDAKEKKRKGNLRAFHTVTDLKDKVRTVLREHVQVTSFTRALEQGRLPFAQVSPARPHTTGGTQQELYVRIENICDMPAPFDDNSGVVVGPAETELWMKKDGTLASKTKTTSGKKNAKTYRVKKEDWSPGIPSVMRKGTEYVVRIDLKEAKKVACDTVFSLWALYGTTLGVLPAVADRYTVRLPKTKGDLPRIVYAGKEVLRSEAEISDSHGGKKGECQ